MSKINDHMAITWPSKSAILLIQVQHQYFLFAHSLANVSYLWYAFAIFLAIIYSDKTKEIV